MVGEKIGHSWVPSKRRKLQGAVEEKMIMNTLNCNDKFDKDGRAIMFNRAMDDAGVVTWKRAATISKECDVSHATASGWLLGSLPREAQSLLRVRDLYNVDIDHWVNGTPRPSVSSDQLEAVERSVLILKSYERDNNTRLSDEQFAKLLSMLLDNQDKTEFLLDNLNILNG